MYVCANRAPAATSCWKCSRHLHNIKEVSPRRAFTPRMDRFGARQSNQKNSSENSASLPVSPSRTHESKPSRSLNANLTNLSTLTPSDFLSGKMQLSPPAVKLQ